VPPAAFGAAPGRASRRAPPGPSHVLLAMGLDPEDAHASVRFSLGEETTEEEVARIGEVTPPVVERLRALAGPGMERAV